MKKGAFLTSQQMMFAVFTFIIVLVGIGIIGYAMSRFQVDERAVDKIRYELRARQLVNNPACFAYEDDLGRTELFVIDLKKFTNNTINSCLLTQTESAGIKMIPGQVILFDKETIEHNTTTWMGTNSMTYRYSYQLFVQDGEERRPAQLAIKLTKVYLP